MQIKVPELMYLMYSAGITKVHDVNWKSPLRVRNGIRVRFSQKGLDQV